MCRKNAATSCEARLWLPLEVGLWDGVTRRFAKHLLLEIFDAITFRNFHSKALLSLSPFVPLPGKNNQENKETTGTMTHE